MGAAECDKYVPISSDERKWYWFVLWSVFIFGAGIVLVIIGRLFSYAFQKRKEVKQSQVDISDADNVEYQLERGWYIDLKEGAGNLVSAQTLQGRILVVLSFVFNLAACALYITESSYPIEHCLDTEKQTLWRVEICLNAFFIFHLIIRFIAANDKLSFWVLDPLTYVDLLTIPSVFVALKLQRNWLGFRFLRVMYMINLADILQFLNVLHAGTSLEMAEIFGNIIAIWLSSAGLVHLLENQGDFWDPINFSNNQTMNIYESVYFLLVTMSTVGYGDISCKTYLGRFFAMLFICVVVGIFASHIPVFVEFFASHTKYDREFKPTPGKRHVIVAGHITEESVTSFFKDFLHPDREDNQTTVVFLAPKYPSLKMQAELQRHITKAAYFIGTVYRFMDCHRTKMREANAVIILCNKKCTDPNEEDYSNITRVISVKNYHEKIRCIVQLMMNQNKSYLLNCPQWKRELGDDIVCINELKLGFIAQSCNAPGFSTLLANLFAMRSDTISEEIHESEQWKVAYMTGAANEMYTAQFSDSFIGLNFQEAVELCFEKLNLMLIAIEMRIPNKKKEKYFAINPSDKTLKIQSRTRGFFFAQDANDVGKASKYCHKCHRDILDSMRMGKCKCKKGIKQKIKSTKKNETRVSLDPIYLTNEVQEDANKRKLSLTGDKYDDGSPPKFDQSGTFYWQEPPDDGDNKGYIKSVNHAIDQQYQNHVVVLVLSKRKSPMIGLRELVLPLRASNNLPNELLKVVILGDKEFLSKEWRRLENFPDVHLISGEPHKRCDLRAVNVNTAKMCILLSPGHGSDADEHQALSDKEVILVTLNLKAMGFESQLVIADGSGASGTSIAGAIEGNEVDGGFPKFTPENDRTRLLTDPSFEDFDADLSGSERFSSQQLQGANIPMITELVCDSNAMYLDQDDMNIYDDDGIFLTQPYACGSAFTVSVLDSLVSATYFNSDILTLVRNLVTGSVSKELDELLREGRSPDGMEETEAIAETRNRCRVAQVSLKKGPLAEYGERGLFGDLFLYALRERSMICLGLYRYRDPQRQNTNGTPHCKKRYVITFPPFNFVLSKTDKVFVLKQFEKPKKSLKMRIAYKNDNEKPPGDVV